MESLYEAWERYKELLRKCPHHGLPIWLQVHTFYNGLFPNNRTMLDAAAGGSLMSKHADEGYNLIEEMASNSYQWGSEKWGLERSHIKKNAGIYGVDAFTALTAQIEALNQKLTRMNVSTIQATNINCDLCGGAHPSSECLEGNSFISSSEHANFVGFNKQQNNSYSNTYNPGWKNHPNFSWSNNQNIVKQPPGFQQPVEKKSDLEDLLKKYIVVNESRFQSQETATKSLEAAVQNQGASIWNLEVQVGQLASVVSRRAQGALPSSTEKNPKEQVKAITLRSGKQIGDEESSDNEGEKEKAPTEEKKSEVPSKESEEVKPYAPPIPFPHRCVSSNA
ncbi:hypothetical protein SLEP1_g3794 [Rubroshorea leprosula]|uniref:Retrotransposon gag domain-containing protein n=1 Tax=Rubroshorea leprosula TaxID=152421 RepID=A0AAV5HM46_9ROSI|nr:hypothetical protein SLEP1_g3794 [Rubroshorea leprosula]